MTIVSSIAYTLCANCASSAHLLKRGHAHQLVVAALGYKTLAAYQASPEAALEFEDVAHVVLDDQLIWARAEVLGLPFEKTELANLLKSAFQANLPHAQFHSSELKLDEYVRDLAQNIVLNHGDTSSAMAMTNNDGINEVYLPIDDVFLADLPPLGEFRDEDVVGHVSMNPDVERPYSGHIIDVKLRLVLERKGQVCIAEPICEVLSSRLNYNWDGDGDDDIPTVSLAQALADELGLELAEAEELVDAEALADESDDGLVYRYIYDFSQHASPAVAEKLMAKYGELQVEVPAWFFERVSPMDYR